MKADGLLLATLALTSCLTREAIVVAPTPAVRTDSLARASFARSAMDLLERIAIEDSLKPLPASGRGRECFEKDTFDLCGSMQDSVVRIEFVQGGTSFREESERIRLEVLQRFRDAFGERRVRECSSHGSVCPRPAQIDSAASAGSY